MIARTWHGRVPDAKANAYEAYLHRTGLADLAATPGKPWPAAASAIC